MELLLGCTLAFNSIWKTLTVSKLAHVIFPTHYFCYVRITETLIKHFRVGGDIKKIILFYIQLSITSWYIYQFEVVGLGGGGSLIIMQLLLVEDSCLVTVKSYW